MIAFTYTRIFEFTTPLSKYLQTSEMILFKSQQFVEATVKALQVIQCDIKAVDLKVSSFVE